MTSPTTPTLLDTTQPGTFGRSDYPEHTYTYLACDLRTDTLLAELPLQGVSYGTVLTGIGALHATIPYNEETLPLDPETATTPGRTALWVDRDGVIVWGGIVWTREAVPGGKQIQAAEFLSYFQYRYIRQTLSTDTSLLTNTSYIPAGQRLYSNQRFIVWSLLRYAEAQIGGSIGLDINPLAAPAAGPTRTTSFYGWERPEIYKAIADLAAEEDGFDFGIEVGWTALVNNEPPKRYKRVRTWHPQRGRTAAASGLVWTKGGAGSNIIDYAWPENGTELATSVDALGAGSGEAKLTANATATDLIAAGWPLLEKVVSNDDLIEQSPLQSLANADLAASSQATTQPWFDVAADSDPAFGSYTVGDRGLFVVDPEPRMPHGRQAELRIVSIETTASSGPERVRLTCVAV